MAKLIQVDVEPVCDICGNVSYYVIGGVQVCGQCKKDAEEELNER